MRIDITTLMNVSCADCNADQVRAFVRQFACEKKKVHCKFTRVNYNYSFKPTSFFP